MISRIIETLINRTLRRQRSHNAHGTKTVTRYAVAKAVRELRLSAINFLRDVFLIGLGIGSAAFGLKSFLLPNEFVDGGATGIALLTSGVSGLPFPILLLLVNIPFILLGGKVIGKNFAMKTALAIVALAIVTAAIPFPEVTKDKLLVSVFGGFFLGAGIGLAVRGGSVIDGTEVLALFLSRKLGTTMGDIILLLNIIIFGFAAWLLTPETALYSMVTYLAASRTVNFVIEGIEEYTGVTIISTHTDEIREMIVTKLGRGITVYKGRRGFGKRGETRDSDILFCVITRLEISKMNAEVEKIDPNAFVVMHSIKDTRGGMIKKRPLEKAH